MDAGQSARSDPPEVCRRSRGCPPALQRPHADRGRARSSGRGPPRHGSPAPPARGCRRRARPAPLPGPVAGRRQVARPLTDRGRPSGAANRPGCRRIPANVRPGAALPGNRAAGRCRWEQPGTRPGIAASPAPQPAPHPRSCAAADPAPAAAKPPGHHPPPRPGRRAGWQAGG